MPGTCVDSLTFEKLDSETCVATLMCVTVLSHTSGALKGLLELPDIHASFGKFFPKNAVFSKHELSTPALKATYRFLFSKDEGSHRFKLTSK